MPLNIPKPCHENWDEMSPTEKGRFCNVCSKTVVDFTKMTDEESLNYFRANKGKRICGKISKKNKPQEVQIQIPISAFRKHLNYSQIFILAFLLVFGLTLTGFTDDSVKKIWLSPNRANSHALDTPPPRPPLIGIVCEEDDVFGTVELHPYYKGGEEARKEYLLNAFKSVDLEKYDSLFPRKVYVRFKVDTIGNLKNITIIKGAIDSTFNQKVINVVSKMPNWNPGKILENPVEVDVVMPIKFSRKED